MTNTTHNPFDETYRVSRLRENLTSGSDGEGLETGRYAVPRQSFTRQVYFKELKQNLGFLKEQSGDFAVCYASVHLSAIRYMLLSNLMLEKGTLKFGQLLNKATGQIELLSFAGMLWEVFKGLLSQTFTHILEFKNHKKRSIPN